MKKLETDTLRPEYSREDLGKGIRGKHFAAFQKGTNLVALQSDVAKAFPNSEAVNEALRTLLKVAADTNRVTRRSSRMPRKRVSV